MSAIELSAAEASVIGLQDYFRLAGSVIIMLASVGCVLTKEQEFREMKKQMEELRILLSMLQNEICHLRLPLTAALQHCRDHIQEPYQRVIEDMVEGLESQSHGDAAQIWMRIMRLHNDEFVLPKEVLALMEEMGEFFRSEQTGLKQELLVIYMDRLALEKAHFEEQLPQRKKVSRFGTVLAGIFVIILLI